MSNTAVSFLFVGILFINNGLLFWKKLITRNNLYGVRCTKTLSSDEIWFEVNKSAGKILTVYGSILAAISLSIDKFTTNQSQQEDILMSTFLIGFLLFISFCFYKTSKTN